MGRGLVRASAFSIFLGLAVAPGLADERTIEARSTAVGSVEALDLSGHPNIAISQADLSLALPPIEPAPIIIELGSDTASGIEVDSIKTVAPAVAGIGSVHSPDPTPDTVTTGALSTPNAYSLAASSHPSVDDGVYGPELPDRRLADAILRNLATRKKASEDGLAQIYVERANRPIWLSETGLNPSVADMLQVLSRAGEHGLQAEAYNVTQYLADLDQQAETDIALTSAIIRYARDARGARVNPRRISSLITAEPTIPSGQDIVAALTSATNPALALEDFQPQHAGYRALKDKLAGLRSDHAQATSAEADIIANMERWRWLPRDLGATHIMVNVPDYTLTVVKDGQIVHRTKIIVGKPQTPTPIFSRAMEYLIVNPYWNIPPSIALKEMLPQLKRDPYALQKKGLEVVRGNKAVDPAGIDWSGNVGSIRLRQPPGERNALGLIKFMFPNDHSVYLHDTPTRGLFSQGVRAFSHGCVRVFEPFTLAEILLDHQGGLSARQLRAMVGKGERYIYLQQKVQVHIAYFTTFVDEKGILETRPDIYGHNAKLRQALGFSLDRVAVRTLKQTESH